MDAHRLTGPRMPRVSDLNIAKNRGIVGVLSFAYTTTSTGTAASAMLPRHSVMPDRDRRLLKARHAVYQSARERNPRRWSGKTRNWTPVSVVTLNPERDAYVQAAGSQIQLSGSIGEPAFPSRPGNAQATEHNGGDGRRGATRSHAQRISLREHGEDGEHRPSPQ